MGSTPLYSSLTVARARLALQQRLSEKVGRIAGSYNSDLSNAPDDEKQFLLDIPEGDRAALLAEHGVDPKLRGKIGKVLTEFEDESERGQESLHYFARQAFAHVDPRPYKDGWHIRGVCRKLESVTAGELKKLLLMMPPGTMKTLLGSILWPSWEWTKDPTISTLAWSYGETVSKRISGKFRKLVESPWYQNRWPIRLTKTSVREIENQFGGWRLSTSPDGEATSLHPDRILCDDPHKASDDTSEANRVNATDFHFGTLATRGYLLPDLAWVYIAQRIHPEDLFAHLIASGDWYIYCLAMEFDPNHPYPNPDDERTEPGEGLWKGVTTPKVIAQAKKDLDEKGPNRAVAQLQQTPSVASGGLFDPDDFVMKHKTDLPLDLYKAPLVRAWDLAATKAGGDYTVGVLMAKHEELIYVVDVQRFRLDVGDRDKMIQRITKLDSQRYGDYRVVIEREPGQSGKSQLVDFSKKLFWVPVLEFRPDKKKVLRAGPVSSQVKWGNVILMENPDWNLPFKMEVGQFQEGVTRDDQVDAFVSAYDFFQGMVPISVS